MTLIPISYDGPNWFALYTAPGCERRAENHMAASGFRTYLPKLRKWVSHARQRKAVEKPLLSRYVFVEVDYPTQSFDKVLAASGAERLIGTNNVPMVIPRQFVEGLLCRQLQGEFDEVAKGPIPVGARVRIVAGQFDNLLATVVGGGGKGKLSLKILDSRETVSMYRQDVRAA